MEEGRMRLPRCVSFQSKLIAVETITLERPPDHSITTLYRHRPRPSVITVWQPDGKRPGPASPIKLYRVVCVYVYIFSLVIHPFSLSLSYLVSHLHHSRSHPVPVEIVGARGTRS